MPNSVEIDHNSLASTSIAGSIGEQKLENPKSDFQKRNVLPVGPHKAVAEVSKIGNL